MSGSSLPRGSPAQSKQISSRLLNMKFMQRAAAVDKNRTPTSPQTPNHGPPLKRRRTDEYLSGTNTPVTPVSPNTGRAQFNSTSHHEQSELASPVARAQNHFGSNTFETEWVLNVKLPGSKDATGVTGKNLDTWEEDNDRYSSDEEDIWGSTIPSGRQMFGSLKKKATMASGGNDAPTPAALSKSARRNAEKRNQKTGLSNLSPQPLADDAVLGSDSDEKSDTDMASDSEGENRDSDESDSRNEDDENIDIQYEGNIGRDSKKSSSTKKKQGINFLSDEYNKQLDSIDFSSSGFSSGLGKQRPGLTGGRQQGGGGGGRTSQGKSSAATGTGSTPKNRSKLGGQGYFDTKKGNKSQNRTNGSEGRGKYARQTM